MFRIIFLLLTLIAAERFSGAPLALSLMIIFTMVAVGRWIVWRAQRRSELAQTRYMQVADGHLEAKSGILTEIWTT